MTKFQKIGPVEVKKTGLKLLVLAMAAFLSLGPFSFDPKFLFNFSSPIVVGLPRAQAISCGFGSDLGNGTCQGTITATSTTSWTVPSDWNNSSNTIEVIGGGGGGVNATANGASGGGGGGGAYAKIWQWSTSTTGGSVIVQIGQSGANGSTPASGTITFFNWNGSGSTSTCSSNMSVCGASGQGGSGTTGGQGGSVNVASSTGFILNAGGGGGNGSSTANRGGGGGGGAGGPFGIGGNGGSSAVGGGGGGGGGNGGGKNGGNATSTGGASGGAAGCCGGTGGASSTAAAGSNGSTGGGGGGASTGSDASITSFKGGNGSQGGDWSGAGSGGAPGGGGGDTRTSGGSRTGGAGGSVVDGTGAGGAGGGAGKTTAGSGSRGASGIIVISYTPSTITLANTTTTLPDAFTVGPTASDTVGVVYAVTSTIFTFKSDLSTSSITNVTTTLATTTGIYQVLLTSYNRSTVYGSSTNPSSATTTVGIQLSTSISVTTASTTYLLLVSPLSTSTIPTSTLGVDSSGRVGASIVVTSTIVGFIDNVPLQKSGIVSTSTIATIDDLSPADVTSPSASAGDKQVSLSWTIPGDADFSSTTVLRATASITDRPAHGVKYKSGDTAGSATVACVASSTVSSCTDTGLTNGTDYYYMIFTQDAYANYSSGTAPSGNPARPSAAKPKISAASSQTFTVGTTNSISAITVTSTAASQITAASGIRITLSTSSGAPVLFWDTSQTTITTSSPSSGLVSSTVSYTDSSSTLLLTVLTDFANASSVTFSGLKYIASSTVNKATTTRDLRWQGQYSEAARDASSTITIIGALDVGQHSAGQVVGQFAASDTYANAPLFAFQLKPTGEDASSTVDIQLSSITGVAASDINAAKIYWDKNANGTVDSGDPVAWDSGSVSVSGATGDILFSTPSSTPNGTSTRLILLATTTNLLAGDTITFGLAASNVTATGTTAGVALSPTSATAPSNVAHTVSAASRTQRSFRWQDDDGLSVNSNTNMAGADTIITGVKIGQRLTLRAQLDNDGGGDSGVAYRLQYQANGTSSTWSDIASGNAIRPAMGLAGSNGDAITSAVAASNNRTFANGIWTSGESVSNSETLLNNRYTELGFVIDTASAATGTTYYFRVINNGTGNPIDGYPVNVGLSTIINDASNTIQYSKQNLNSLPTGTSSLKYFFDDLDYTNVASDDTASSTITATSTNFPMFMFRIKTATTTHPIKTTWKGQQTNSTTTLIEIYRFGSTNAWIPIGSTSSNPVSSDFSFSGRTATSVTEYYQADGANWWSYIRVRQNAVSSTASLRTNLIDISYQPAGDSGSNQTFTVNDAATSISQLRIKAASTTPVITPANGIRIVIPDSVNMLWATSTTSATLGGSASGNVSSTVSYPNSKTLLLNVTSSFASNDDLTVSGLSFTNFTTSSAAASLAFFYGGSTSTNPDYVDTKTKTIKGQYVLGAHAAGQQPNKWDTNGNSVTDTLLNFQIAPVGESATNTQLVINLTDIQGIVSADVTSSQLFMDLNNNGAIDAGEPQVGSTGTVSISGSSGTITFSGSFVVTSTRNMILRSTVNDLQPGDGANFFVSSDGFTASGQTSQLALAASGTSQSARHNKPSAHGGGGGAFGGAPPWAANVGGGGQGSGGGEAPGGGGSPPPNQGGGSGGGGGEAP